MDATEMDATGPRSDALEGVSILGDWSGAYAVNAADDANGRRCDIADAVAWGRFWREAVGREPPCDWPDEAAIAAAFIAPLAPTGGFTIVARRDADSPIVFYRLAPPDNAPRTTALTRPWRVILHRVRRRASRRAPESAPR